MDDPNSDSDPNPATRENATRRVLRVREVRIYLLARFASLLARSLIAATLSWHLWGVTEAAFWLGVVGFVQFAPVIPISLYAGAFADLADRRRILISTQSLSLLGAIGLAGIAGQGAFERELILVAAFVMAIATAFEHPAGSAIMPSLVPREIFPAATVLFANFRNVAMVSGPVLMGAITARFGIPAAYAVASVLLGVSLAALSSFTLPAREHGGEKRVSWTSIGEGIAFVRAKPVILGSMTLDMFAVIFAGATALLPVYADEILGVGEFGYGLLSASMQLGTMTMAALLLWLPPIERPGRALNLSVLLFGLATIVFGLSRSFPLSVAAFAVAGMADQVSMVTRSVILQLATPDALRGRVNSVNLIFIGASNELGAAESGFLAALTSATVSVVAGGCACLGVLGIVEWRLPELRAYRIDAQEPEAS